MLPSAISVVDPDQTTVLDLLRVIDYPTDYVPLIAEPPSSSLTAPTQGKARLRVINKATLNARLAKMHIDDMLTSIGLRSRF